MVPVATRLLYSVRVTPFGERNSQWKGHRAEPSAGWQRAQKLVSLEGVTCERCGRPAQDRHHIDGNPLNNARENIACLCRRCHMEADGRLEQLLAMRPSGGDLTGGGRRKLTEWQVRVIRGTVATVSGAEWGRRLGVPRQKISQIRSDKIFRADRYYPLT